MLRDKESSYGSSTVYKAMSVLDAIANERRPMSAAEIAQNLKMNGSSIYRLLSTLVRSNYLTQERGTSKYFLGHKILMLSAILLESMDVRQIARPLMTALMHKTKEAIHLLTLEGTEGVYIERVTSSQSIQMISNVGRRESLHASSAGKAILAFLPEHRIEEIIGAGLQRFTANTIVDPSYLREHLRDIRARGYAIDDVEGENGVRCIGTAVFNHLGVPKYGISIAGPAYRLSIERLLGFTGDLLETASRISEALGYMPDENIMVK